MLILAVDDGEHLAGGVVLHRTSEVVGLSNVFTLDSSNAPAVWSSAITTAANHFPAHPLVGYEREDDLALALASGFVALGPFRVWLHRPSPSPPLRVQGPSLTGTGILGPHPDLPPTARYIR